MPKHPLGDPTVTPEGATIWAGPTKNYVEHRVVPINRAPGRI